MTRQLEGSRAVAETVAARRPEVIAASPISPQTHIIEQLSGLVREGAVGSCEFVAVESEFAAMSVAIGASAAGPVPAPPPRARACCSCARRCTTRRGWACRSS